MMKKALILGDSNTWGYDPRGYLQRYDLTYVDYLNKLVSGWMFFEDGQNGRLLRDVKDDSFDVNSIDLFSVMLGSNDLIHYYEVDEIVGFMQTLIDKIDKNKVLILCPPVLKDSLFYNESLQLNEAYNHLGVKCIDANPLDMSFDCVHLSEKGHKELALRIAEYLKTDFECEVCF
ncbi:SGNH/GDSL hydrolase family protein [uncultured Holdemanella sp.]|uniref:SGNH/GDSL hydrolase family protein n=1 Tax=uncultured Holdemanella sp. TaxID=1763549 RepID=UPI0025ECDC3E|nr:SGNH/GDSL hydrolase family protein [uncultured Holdemanella sp.]